MHLPLYSFMPLPGFNWMHIYFCLLSWLFSCVNENIRVRWLKKKKKSRFPCKGFSLLNPYTTLLTCGHPLPFRSTCLSPQLPLPSVKGRSCDLNSGLHTVQRLQINHLVQTLPANMCSPGGTNDPLSPRKRIMPLSVEVICNDTSSAR